MQQKMTSRVTLGYARGAAAKRRNGPRMARRCRVDACLASMIVFATRHVFSCICFDVLFLFSVACPSRTPARASLPSRLGLCPVAASAGPHLVRLLQVSTYLMKPWPISMFFCACFPHLQMALFPALHDQSSFYPPCSSRVPPVCVHPSPLFVSRQEHVRNRSLQVDINVCRSVWMHPPRHGRLVVPCPSLLICSPRRLSCFPVPCLQGPQGCFLLVLLFLHFRLELFCLSSCSRSTFWGGAFI